MRSGWKRLGAYFATVAGVVAVVAIATRNETRSGGLLVAQAGFIGIVSYLTTFLVWPRRPHVSPTHPSRGRALPPVTEESLDLDPRPVLVIGDRPAGSRPGSKVHMRDVPTVRGPRGRRPGQRGGEEIRWPARRQ